LAYGAEHSLDERHAVESVTMDMWPPYIASTPQYISEADSKIAFDKFHVAQHLGNAVNRVRSQEHKHLHSQGDERLKSTKHMWLRNPNGFSARGRARPIPGRDQAAIRYPHKSVKRH
jgi:transposase